MDKKQGKLIALEGIDGSGKTTQIELLRQYLASKSPTLQVEVISFPQYGKNEYAKQITDYLEGKLGKLEEVDPYIVAKFYAQDRLTAKDLIKSWLVDGKLAIANRYVSSSKAHLAAHLPEGKREEFIRWVDDLEYQKNQMPREDLTILLNVDPKIGQKNALSKNSPDIHEEDLSHEEKAAQIYLELSQRESNWVVVDCMEDGKMKSKEDINKELIQKNSHLKKLALQSNVSKYQYGKKGFQKNHRYSGNTTRLGYKRVHKKGHYQD